MKQFRLEAVWSFYRRRTLRHRGCENDPRVAYSDDVEKVEKKGDPLLLPESHPDLPPDLAGQGPQHAHILVIDDLHRHWPKAV